MRVVTVLQCVVLSLLLVGVTSQNACEANVGCESCAADKNCLFCQDVGCIERSEENLSYCTLNMSSIVWEKCPNKTDCAAQLACSNCLINSQEENCYLNQTVVDGNQFCRLYSAEQVFSTAICGITADALQTAITNALPKAKTYEILNILTGDDNQFNEVIVPDQLYVFNANFDKCQADVEFKAKRGVTYNPTYLNINVTMVLLHPTSILAGTQVVGSQTFSFDLGADVVNGFTSVSAGLTEVHFQTDKIKCDKASPVKPSIYVHHLQRVIVIGTDLGQTFSVVANQVAPFGSEPTLIRINLYTTTASSAIKIGMSVFVVLICSIIAAL